MKLALLKSEKTLLLFNNTEQLQEKYFRKETHETNITCFMHIHRHFKHKNIDKTLYVE